MDREVILNVLPHRYPFLFVDDIFEVEYQKRVVGIKNVSFNEPWILGHFPDEPVFPGVLLIEAMAQICGFIFYDEQKGEKFISYLSKINNAKFIEKVVPGDTVVVEGYLENLFGNFAKVKAVARVNKKKVAEAEITYFFQRNN
ncbi:3-hydroxyacyl-ACP dehydratase FabZ [Clostridium sp. YIM B02505]|uniref:3-hydroxyacyl-ACP dehydratase FabZ n=1 Tax=Clostridium yunnanense TaxID=2800325 RepID=A0ABS1ERN5_9CLOT|nr:3-hydroxyacyl-ACP dehydratase FabZ [Clostridium yunnanense]MBK1811994.1 3-hydroxyacyl-ACP dehydratase FabZ [Clostridium yunnanense]